MPDSPSWMPPESLQTAIAFMYALSTVEAIELLARRRAGSAGERREMGAAIHGAVRPR